MNDLCTSDNVALDDHSRPYVDLSYIRETSLESGSGPTELELVDFISRSLAQVREARRQLAILRKGR